MLDANSRIQAIYRENVIVRLRNINYHLFDKISVAVYLQEVLKSDI